MTLRPFHLAFPVHDLEPPRARSGAERSAAPRGAAATSGSTSTSTATRSSRTSRRDAAHAGASNPVDGHDVPVPHFGIVLTLADWQALADRLTAAGTAFEIEPHVRFKGQPGEQATMFFRDPERQRDRDEGLRRSRASCSRTATEPGAMRAMARQRMMRRFARWHIWLGWLVGFPILMWTVTGLCDGRAADRGSARRRTCAPSTAAIDPAQVRFPQRIGEPIHEARLVAQPDGPAWIVTAADGDRWRYSARYGTATPPVVEDEARRIARGGLCRRGQARAASTYFPRRRSADRARADGRRVAGALRRRHPRLHRRRDRRSAGAAHRPVAALRYDVGPAHHGPADPRGHPPPDPDRVRRAGGDRRDCSAACCCSAAARRG